MAAHDDAVVSVSFSPDGQTIVSGSFDYTIKLWKRDGTPITTLKGHDESVWSVSFSPDGQTIASGGSIDKTVKLWSWNLDNLIELGCNWVQDYLRTN
ncbi:PD40 domain-containing protein [Leptolyngbya sp. FACHB-17]|uniref:WD40 repeat domain-containing protein n=1 Tax=unclassified Leptolyngbya TaxID=2650499 RepID=UPI0018EFF4C8|nr:PD40 domain-containing protein [Leptolyngbya sp. FACHB-17]